MNEPQLTSLAIDAAAIEKANMPGDWQPYYYQRENGGIVVTGCKTRLKKSGPNKGMPLYLTKEGECRVIITPDDVDRHKAALRYK